MRTNIVIDDALMQQAMQAAGAHSKRETVEMGLRALVQLGQQAEFRAFRGKLRWEGSLDNQRLDGPTASGSGQPA
jgi:Arc/MetJ family transcription regulator